jgi:hypothetical protein
MICIVLTGNKHKQNLISIAIHLPNQKKQKFPSFSIPPSMIFSHISMHSLLLGIIYVIGVKIQTIQIFSLFFFKKKIQKKFKFYFSLFLVIYYLIIIIIITFISNSVHNLYLPLFFGKIQHLKNLKNC